MKLIAPITKRSWQTLGNINRYSSPDYKSWIIIVLMNCMYKQYSGSEKIVITANLIPLIKSAREKVKGLATFGEITGNIINLSFSKTFRKLNYPFLCFLQKVNAFRHKRGNDLYKFRGIAETFAFVKKVAHSP